MDRATILYDADCGFCRWSTERILAWDRRGWLRPVALQDPEADELLPGMSEERKMGSWHLVTADGEVYSGGDAVPELLRLLPGGTRLASLAAAAPGLTDSAYDLVSRHRDRLARLLGKRAERADPQGRRGGRPPS